MPVVSINGHGKKEYRVMHDYEHPQSLLKKDIHRIFPDPQVTKFIFHGTMMSRKVETIKDNPHRILSRLVWGLFYFEEKYEKRYNEFTTQKINLYKKTFSADIQLIRNYLRKTNNNNRSMVKLFQLLDGNR